jgi:hypothetical protein
VAFGDVNLSEEQVRGKYAGSPGGGGWPTIRAYNKQTGYDGVFAGDWKDANKLQGAMCDVFGKDENMQKYVEELGSTSLCKASDGAGCSEKEVGFIDKWKEKPAEEVVATLTRLQGMSGASMKPELKLWLGQRIAILKQLAPKGEAKEEL